MCAEASSRNGSVNQASMSAKCPAATDEFAELRDMRLRERSLEKVD